MLLLVCSGRHGGQAGLQEQNCISSLETKLVFHANSVKKNLLFVIQHGSFVTWLQTKNYGSFLVSANHNTS